MVREKKERKKGKRGRREMKKGEKLKGDQKGGDGKKKKDNKEAIRKRGRSGRLRRSINEGRNTGSSKMAKDRRGKEMPEILKEK